MDRAGASRHVAMQITGHKTEAMYRRYNIVNTHPEESLKLIRWVMLPHCMPTLVAAKRALPQDRGYCRSKSDSGEDDVSRCCGQAGEDGHDREGREIPRTLLSWR
jgi:hypothetical protein